MRRVLREGGRAALSVFGPIERTPGANAFVRALDEVLGPDASRIKRGEHTFADPAQLNNLLRDAGFGAIDVATVKQTIVFPSVLDYVRFQFGATPMTALLNDRDESERQVIISSVASKVSAFSMPAMLSSGMFTFPQEAFVAVAQSAL
jgi:hypothetical protein